MTTPLRQTFESQAVKLLEQMYGYTHRQEWTAKDKMLLADLLEEWENQVTDLLVENDLLKKSNAQLRELNHLYEWRLSGRGLGHYLKFLFGIVECPSR